MSDWTRILCAVDLQQDPRLLCDTAASLAAKLGAELTLLYVVPTGEPRSIIAPPERIDALVSEASAPLRALAETTSAALGRTVATRVAHGDPAAEILRASRDTGCHILALATHGRHGLQRAIFGSVAEKVVRGAPCPVLTVRPQ